MTDTLRTFDAGKGKTGLYYSLPALEEKGLGKISRLPVSIRIVLESVLRNCDGKKVTDRDVAMLAAWNAKSPAPEEIPFVVARIVLQDFTGVPLLVDLAAMRTAVATLKKNPKIIEPSGSRGSRGRPLGAGGLLWVGRCFATEPRNGVQAQSREIQVPEMGSAGF